MNRWILIADDDNDDGDLYETHAMNTPTGIVMREYSREFFQGSVAVTTTICHVPGVHVTDDGELVPLSERYAAKGDDE